MLSIEDTEFGKENCDIVYKELSNDITEEINSRMDGAEPKKVEFIPLMQVSSSMSVAFGGSKEAMDSRLRLEAITVAMQFPEEYKGSFTILADNRPIYEVVNGRITQDELSLTSAFRFKTPKERTLDYSNRMIRGEQVLKEVNQYLGVMGKKQADGSVSYTTKRYIFNKSNGQLKVKPVGGSMPILNNRGFTLYANETDIERMFELKKGVQKVEKEWGDKENNKPTQKQSSRFKL
jgi:hypothetical protein